MPELEVAGIFTAVAKSAYMGDPKAGSQSMPVVITFEALHQRGEPDADGNAAWTEIAPGYTIDAYYYVTGKKGDLFESKIKTLVECLGWDADFTSVGQSWPPADGTARCQITVKQEEYKGKPTFKVEWINPYDFVGGARQMAPDKVSEMQARFGAQMRAIASGAASPATPSAQAASGGAAPSGAAAASPPAAGAVQTTMHPEGVAKAKGIDVEDTPF